MGCHARFGHHVHGLRSNLEFNIHASRANQGGMQRLVAIDFRNSDVIFELAGNGLVQLVHQAEGGVAIKGSRYNDAEPIDIRHLREAEVFFIHFSVDGVERFLATIDLRVHVDR